MKRKPREIIVELGGEKEYFIASTYVSRVFSAQAKSDNPDEAAQAYGRNPLETIIKLTQIAYNEHPNNVESPLDDKEICYLIDEISEELDENGASLWDWFQEELTSKIFPGNRKVKNQNGEAAKELTSP